LISVAALHQVGDLLALLLPPLLLLLQFTHHWPTGAFPGKSLAGEMWIQSPQP
jgi:hypothetical protein